jgi:hypothetical protein
MRPARYRSKPCRVGSPTKPRCRSDDTTGCPGPVCGAPPRREFPRERQSPDWRWARPPRQTPPFGSVSDFISTVSASPRVGVSREAGVPRPTLVNPNFTESCHSSDLRRGCPKNLNPSELLKFDSNAVATFSALKIQPNLAKLRVLNILRNSHSKSCVPLVRMSIAL